MSILEYKYKAHKLVNVLFYAIVFVMGFILGYGIQKISFNKLISQVLMIENVQALEIGTIGDYTITDEFIYNHYNDNYPNFLEEFPYVVCQYYYKGNGSPTFTCQAFNEDYLSRLYVSKTHTNYYLIGRTEGESIEGKKSALVFTISKDGVLSIPSTAAYVTATESAFYLWTSSSSYYSYTNFDPTIITGSDSSFGYELNTLDFSEYEVNLEFNENLFEENEDFKKVCLSVDKTYAITSTSLSDVNSSYDYDYMWFSYNLSGVFRSLYDTGIDSNVNLYDEDEAYLNYFFSSKDVINNYFDSDVPGLELEAKNYIDRYQYYMWTAYPFRMYYGEDGTQFTTVKLVDPKILGKAEASPNLNHEQTSTDFDNSILLNESYCFYIKNQYEIQEIHMDEYGDYYGTVVTPNGDYDFTTSLNKDNSDINGYLSQPQNFIKKITPTLLVVNNLIYEFYLELPLLLRMYIITFFVIILVLLFMKLGGFGT